MLRIDADVREEVIAHARDGVPEEVCGVLGGTRETSADTSPSGGTGRTDRVETARRVENAAADPRTRYEMAPVALLEAIEALESAGDDVAGFYHSHPRGPAEPSATDRERATWDGYCYVIVSPRSDDAAAATGTTGSTWAVRAWRWDADAGRFREESVVTE
ncbi:hypothetical protein GCM10027435_27700 [Haloparvum alkalitolerans]|uniref:desampylase n=1 Tax=Haloparvum alkalitolerans TaxID=1042953 RepID=UPI003CEC8580